MIAQTTTQEKVTAGAALLDEKAPGWRAKISPATLDMYLNCVLDQVMGGYHLGLVRLGLGASNSRVTDLGFRPTDGNEDDLRDAWIAEAQRVVTP